MTRDEYDRPQGSAIYALIALLGVILALGWWLL
jgi:hypothetical protein